MGFVQYNRLKQTGVPVFIGVQAEGSAPLVLGKIVEQPETVATAIRIGNPVRGTQALEVIQKTKGKILAVSDDEIIAAQKLLAGEGIWVEPASAAGLAGLIKEANSGLVLDAKQVVIVCTGHGLKDPDIVDLAEPAKVKPLYADVVKLL